MALNIRAEIMFFYLIRPLIRWKTQCLIDDHRTPGGFLLWLLKKDSVSWQYYQRLLQLETRLQESGQLQAAENSLLSQPLANKHVSESISRKKPQYLHSHKLPNTKGRKSAYPVSFSALAMILIIAAIFLRWNGEPNSEHNTALLPPQPTISVLPDGNIAPSNDKTDNIGNHYVDSSAERLQIGDISEYLAMGEQAVPSGVREVFRPALIPLQETYQVGKEQLLEDLSSLPLKPLARWGRLLTNTTSDENPLVGTDTTSQQAESHELADAGLLQKLLDFEQIKAKWLPSPNAIEQ